MCDVLIYFCGNLLLGAVLGGVGGLFGIGGGLIAIPVLGMFYGMDQQLSQGTALVMVVPNVLIGFWRYRQRNSLDLRAASMLGGSAVLVTYATAWYATVIAANTLHFAFAVFMEVLGCYLLWNLLRKKSLARTKKVLGLNYLPVVGVVGGAVSGFFGVGGGVVAPPALVAFFGTTQTAAQGMALALVSPGAVVALCTFAYASHVNWIVGIPLAIGGIVSVSSGVALAHQLPERRLRLCFSLALIVLAGRLMLRG
ncbi:sulfite exporter TauE/SafE family protein [Glaciimonas sp. CA11.2]|uniref:sulfite exporter TauE/SafE family protein n=1 Tax=unclassified Glaciimonas TaxID=2644401 RepID=UPI002AB58446|nr:MULTISPECIES: sulfite exporter TauE/SafE family protein [unclassified Glaciimonas]MDY7544978.1 sulfite exporter TauE/SafE family protein [Glaciimonas sp. CA11.2]MEB0013281.1 sulfite exporter TauE/SafE family protein [Glaciimonas sp. Cout2]MEB0082478.1 sulfite exporter TauE/SafE family protein [Glaciimonas sp. Gout2]MEB0164086.1 sulfite exporter TauE/SafE family protein [Glaciimonas sp. CA11.2]